MGHDKEVMASLVAIVKEQVREVMQTLAPLKLLSADEAESFVREAGAELSGAIAEVWAEEASALALELAGMCPGCGGKRKVHPRTSMTVTMLGVEVEVPKPYLDCGTCDAPGISIMRVLTGLRDKRCAAQLKLMIAYLGSQMSYGKTSRDLAVHHQVDVDRNKARRICLQVEEEALRFAERQRCEALETVGRPGRTSGVERLMLQADGGSVRVGELRDTTPDDDGHGELTATRRQRRAKDVSYREIITLDVRRPGSVTDACMDALVPRVSPDGERSRRMLAMAQRAGLGEETKVRGLGDMGSSLATSFDEAFFAYDSEYCADWKHTTNYVEDATEVLTHKSPEDWASRMKDAIWERNRGRVNRLLKSARRRRVEQLPASFDKCPLEKLATYIENNWERFLAKSFEAAGLDFVSARAEAQVRDRTKARFSGAGTWCTENLEGKAILRAIIEDGRWDMFCQHYRRETSRTFRGAVEERVRRAVTEDRLAPDVLHRLGLDETDATHECVA